MGKKYDDYTDLVLPGRSVTEVRVPLPPKEVELSDTNFGTTDLEPQYATSYVDTVIWEDHKKRGTTGELLNMLRESWYRKLNIRTTAEKMRDDAWEYYKQLQESVDGGSR